MGWSSSSRFVEDVKNEQANKDLMRKLIKQKLSLIIHELGHHASYHVEKQYHQLLTDLGAQLTILALDKPTFFQIK